MTASQKIAEVLYQSAQNQPAGGDDGEPRLRRTTWSTPRSWTTRTEGAECLSGHAVRRRASGPDREGTTISKRNNPTARCV